VNRADALKNLQDSRSIWDFVVIGGGATGLGTAVEAASRGYRTLLLEQSDFGKGTSSRSTKLIHGGFRYLRQGHFSLVLESLRERGLLLQNAPHLVHRLSFIVPCYSRWETPYYGAGLKLYDLLAGRLGLGPSRLISRGETLQELPTLSATGLRGGIRYYDGQFDDARLAICLARTLVDLGGVAVNYLRVKSLLKRNERVTGVSAEDLESGVQHELHARAVVNATGVFTDALRRMDDSQTPNLIAPSQGAHIVLNKSFLPGESALMLPRTEDGRILFAVPWHTRVVVGTTDTPVAAASLEPHPLPEEIDFLLKHVAHYLIRRPTESDILSVFAGLRPLVKSGAQTKTARLHRDHALSVSRSGLVTITGGKWTTFRRMGEDTVDLAANAGGLGSRPSCTKGLRLHGWSTEASEVTHWQVYGTDIQLLQQLIRENHEWNSLLHPRLPYRAAEIILAVRHEMARTLEDVLSRRTRALLLDARASIESAPLVASLMAKALGRDQRWIAEQVAAFVQLAHGYLPAGASGGFCKN
jgi:glycerol-3-phosphate dehydrogenase